jgi:hypothetical protein
VPKILCCFCNIKKPPKVDHRPMYVGEKSPHLVTLFTADSFVNFGAQARARISYLHGRICQNLNCNCKKILFGNYMVPTRYLHGTYTVPTRSTPTWYLNEISLTNLSKPQLIVIVKIYNCKRYFFDNASLTCCYVCM